MTLSKFLTYWSLTFAILFIWGFSIAVALADVKDDVLAKLRKKMGRARLRPVNPLAGRSIAETMAPTAMDEKERWVFYLVSGLAIALKLPVGILVLQDSMGHYLVHFTQGKRLISYRVDKAWVTDAMAGKADQRERINAAVEQYLRQEFLGQPIVAKAAPTPAKAPTPATPAAAGASAPAAAKQAGVTPAGATAPPPGPGGPPAGQEMSREERIAAAKAKAEAIKAQRAAGAQPPQPHEGEPPAQPRAGEQPPQPAEGGQPPPPPESPAKP